MRTHALIVYLTDPTRSIAYPAKAMVLVAVMAAVAVMVALMVMMMAMCGHGLVTASWA